MALKDKTHIMVHCLATLPDWGRSKPAAWIMKEVTAWHVNKPPEGRGWAAVAYAAIIGYDGKYALGRDLDGDGDVFEETGAGATGWNKNTIHIALVGGKYSKENDDFYDHYTEAQNQTLMALIAMINTEAGRNLKVIGHNQVAAKACPGFDVQKWLHDDDPRVPDVPKDVAPATNLFSSLISFIVGLLARRK